jgi:hypothetical protein
MSHELKSEVFEPVVKRIIEKSDSLREIKRFQRTGIEGWFKVEIVAALRNMVKSLQNKGPDLLLDDDTQIEIKAATDFHKGFFIGPIRKYDHRAHCLFLGDGGDGTEPTKLTSCTEPDIDVVAYKVFPDGKNNWLLGLVSPKIPRT